MKPLFHYSIQFDQMRKLIKRLIKYSVEEFKVQLLLFLRHSPDGVVVGGYFQKLLQCDANNNSNDKKLLKLLIILGE